jgi:hypothetical protein
MPDMTKGIAEIQGLRNKLEEESKAKLGEMEDMLVGQFDKVKAETEKFTDPGTFIAPIKEAYEANATRLANMSTANSRLALEQIAAMEADSPDARLGVRFRQRLQGQREVIEAQAKGLADLDMAVADGVVKGISIAAENKAELNRGMIQGYTALAATAAEFFGKYAQMQASLVLGESDAITQAAKITADLIMSKESIKASRASTAAQLDANRLKAKISQGQDQTALEIAQIEARALNPIREAGMHSQGTFIGTNFDPLTGRTSTVSRPSNLVRSRY